MMQIKRLTSTSVLLILAVTTQARAQLLWTALNLQPHHFDIDHNDNDGDSIVLVQLLSMHSFNKTYDRLVAAINANGAIKVVAKIDHQQNAQSVGLELSPIRLVVFGNPALGTPLMLRNQITGLNLPQTMLVWEETNQDADGSTVVYVGYNSATYLRARHPGIGRVDTLATIAGALSALGTATTGVGMLVLVIAMIISATMTLIGFVVKWTYACFN